jgi:hypothetical protein
MEAGELSGFIDIDDPKIAKCRGVKEVSGVKIRMEDTASMHVG